MKTTQGAVSELLYDYHCLLTSKSLLTRALRRLVLPHSLSPTTDNLYRSVAWPVSSRLPSPFALTTNLLPACSLCLIHKHFIYQFGAKPGRREFYMKKTGVSPRKFSIESIRGNKILFRWRGLKCFSPLSVLKPSAYH